MVSRRFLVQERRTTRRAIVLFAASGILLLILLFFGIPSLAQFAAIIGEFKGSSVPIIQEDKTPPAPPYDYPLPKYSKEAKVTLVGVAEAGTTLKVFNNGNVIKETLVDETASFSLEIQLELGENHLWLTATDAAGNESEKSSGSDIIYDTEAPLLTISSPQDGEELGQAQIEVKGQTEAGVQVIINGRLVIVDAEGNFSHKLTLTSGENTIQIVATDPAENKTEKTIKVALKE